MQYRGALFPAQVRDPSDGAGKTRPYTINPYNDLKLDIIRVKRPESHKQGD
jgi:hypothetical protein